MKSPRLLVLASDYGRGHRSAANALACAASLRGFEVRVVNPLHHPLAPRGYRWSENEYVRSLRHYPWGYDWLYRVTDTPARSHVIRQLVAHQLVPAVQSLICEWPADLVIGTFPIFTAAVRCAVLPFAQPTLATVVTDPGAPHTLWFDPDDDYCTVATAESQNRAVQLGVVAERVAHTGVPIHPAFTSAASQSEARAHLGWRADLPAVLVLGGGAGIGGMLALAKQIEQACLPVQMALVAGSNTALYRTLQQRRWRIPAFVYGDLPTLVDVLSAADMVVSRAGGLSVSEACALGKPLILYGTSPGQEQRNRELLCQRGAARSAASAAEVVQAVRRWLDFPDERQVAATAARSLGRSDAAETILTHTLAHAR